jgi:hypothetical protein
MFQIGLGTMVFHSGIRPNPIYEIVDYYPMIVLGAALMYIYVSFEFEQQQTEPWARVLFYSAYSRLGWGFLLSCWVFALFYLLDDEIIVELQASFPGGEYLSYLNTLNIALVLPMVLIFVMYCRTVIPWGKQVRVWLLLFGAMGCYFLNYIVCHQAYILALLHGVYHILMAFALWNIACLGISMRKRWEVDGFQLN